MRIPMSSTDVTPLEIQAVADTLQSGTLSFGSRLRAFESATARYLGLPFAAAVNSGTSALHLAVIAAALQDGDLGITTPFSFIASANCLLYERAVPLFVDVEPSTGNIDPAQVQEAAHDIEAGRETARRWLPRSMRQTWRPGSARLKALLPVHTFGQPADMDPLCATARDHGLAIIEDACEAIGAEYLHRRVGTLGDAAVFAFYPNKQMTTGEGGMLVTARRDWHDLFLSLRNQGRDLFDAWLNHSRLGYNYRLDEMSAALGTVQLTRLDELLEKRARVARWYSNHLEAYRELIEPPVVVSTTTRMSWFVYVVRLASWIDRDKLMRDLEERGIPSRPYFTPIHLQPFYRDRFGYEPGDFPEAESLSRRSLALPFSSVMTEEQVNHVWRHVVELAKAEHVVSKA